MLALSTKYALKALIYLAKEAPPGEFLQVKTLSEAADVPGPYLAKLIKVLAAKRLVETKRGLSGGVRFAKRKKPLSFYDVCVALDDPVVTHACFLSKYPCNSRAPCQMHVHWSGLKADLIRYLQEGTIEGSAGSSDE